MSYGYRAMAVRACVRPALTSAIHRRDHISTSFKVAIVLKQEIERAVPRLRWP